MDVHIIRITREKNRQKVAYFRKNRHPSVKWGCDIWMESLLCLLFGTAGNNFHGRYRNVLFNVKE